mmetsp:Transcript_14391/g.20279  ORF Transcript_14391/g.20279 Transcript_14391/m.20279 type:complete len:215 (+) Transcript_14391:210-854(+)
MKISVVSLLSTILCCSGSFTLSDAFVSNAGPSVVTPVAFRRSTACGPPSATTARTTTTSHNMVVDPSSFSISTTNFLISTIDSDIAKIPENEFAPVFMGGIAVMFGGVLSALIVGAILESRDSYASIVADSYAQGADDEEFWKGLNDEEKVRVEALLQKVRDSKNKSGEGSAPQNANALTEETPAAASSTDATPASSVQVPKKEEKELDMFSDY